MSSLEQRLARIEEKLKQENEEARRRIEPSINMTPQRSTTTSRVNGPESPDLQAHSSSDMEHPSTDTGHVNIGSLTSTLPVIPYQKLTDLHCLSRWRFGTVFKAQHSDWRTTVALKCLKLDSPVGERDWNCLLKEAEVLHKARFNYIIQIFGVCNEPELFCIVTEFMSNGSLKVLLHERGLYPVLAWPLRLRVLYEIALGVNFLHNMTPPLLHHDLKTQNILMDGEYHVKIADFGLSKWRQLSISKGSGSKQPEKGGPVIYMPPEQYDPSKSRRADVKHDIYSYAIIMWEVLSRRIPYEEMTNPMQIMFSVLRGLRPDTGTESLSPDIPGRETLISLMSSGWTANPDERPSSLKCLIELEPMLRRFDEIDFLEAVLEVKKSKLMRGTSCCPASSGKKKEDKPVNTDHPELYRSPSSTSDSGSCSSQDTEMSLPAFLTNSNTPPGTTGVSSFMPHSLEPPQPLRVQSPTNNNLNECSQAAASNDKELNIPTNPCLPITEEWSEPSLKPQPQPQPPPPPPPPPSPPKPADNDDCHSPPTAGPVARWIGERREEIVSQMTEACLNQSLDALLARQLLMVEDYELVQGRPTRTAKVRQLLDTCDRHNEGFCRIVVRKLQDNRQLRLQPFPSGLCPPTPSAPFLSQPAFFTNSNTPPGTTEVPEGLYMHSQPKACHESANTQFVKTSVIIGPNNTSNLEGMQGGEVGSLLELLDETYLSSCFSDCRMGESLSLPRSHSLTSLSHIPYLENKTGFRAKRRHSVNDVTLLDKTQTITPDIILVENKESYRFHCTRTGLFKCSVTGLVFKFGTEGDVTYRTVPWHRLLLSQLGKRPAGPLFDIKCPRMSVCQLHFPHCEILSTGGGKCCLAVVHVMDDDGIELIYPDVITETHVIINVNGFSAYGIINDVDSPNPVQALVSLFYTPPIEDDDDPSSVLKVLLLPENVVLSEVLHTRRKINGDEIYIEKPPCELIPKQEYTLSTSPQDDSITIEPSKAKFNVDASSYHNYISTFEVTLEAKFKHVRLLLRHSNTSDCAWERCVKLSALALRKHQVQRTLTLPAEERLFSVRGSFIDNVSLPNLNCLLDKLFTKEVLTDAEREMAAEMQAKKDKARFVIDTVRHKGPDASSSMILILCGLDSCLSKHLGLM